jgi:hypothetical protein
MYRYIDPIDNFIRRKVCENLQETVRTNIQYLLNKDIHRFTIESVIHKTTQVNFLRELSYCYQSN